MKIERIRKNHKKEIIIGIVLLVVIGGALTFRLTQSKYRVTQSINLATGKINYKVPDFKVMAMYKSENGTNYTEITSMPSSGYVINEDKTYCTTSSGSQVKGKIKTVNGNHVISNLSKGDKCYLYFDKQLIASETILANVTVKSGTPTFSQISTTNEGVYATNDGMYGGTTYYWRGAVTNNYVKFAGYCWRIIRINGDKTMRLIYDGSTCHANGTNTSESIAVTGQVYNSSTDRSEYVGWTYSIGSQHTTSGNPSNIKKQTDNWFSANITGTNADKVADGKFCNDRNTASGSTWSSQPSSTFRYAAYERSGVKSTSSVSPILSCPSEDVYTMKAGTITMDEVVMAGVNWETANNNYYLYNGQYYWTISPFYWLYVNSSNRGAGVFIVKSDGSLSFSAVGSFCGVRIVINLNSDVTFSSGNGTQNNPYIVAN